MVRTAGIVVIGSEILSGRTADRNSIFLLRELHALGVEIRRVAVVPDDVVAISEAVGAFSSAFDLVFTTGGVGPTHDDVTMAAIARAFDRGLERRIELVRALERYYGDNFPRGALAMADVPEGAVLVTAENALFPVVTVENVYILPGVPEILASKFRGIRERFRTAPYHDSEIFLGVDEGVIADPLREVAALFPDVALGSYPSFDDPTHLVRLTLESKDAGRVEAARECLLEKLASRAIVPVPAPPAPSNRPAG